MQPRLTWLVPCLASLLLAACGLSPEQQQATSVALTATAASPTPTNTPVPPTPTPTPTPTPIPYDLSVSVTDEQGNAIDGAVVTLAEVEGPQTTDTRGQVAWADLQGESAALSVKAQGYFPGETATTLQRGPNEAVVVLERDPFGLLTSQACGDAETLVYVEDFQDGHPQGWPDIEFRAQGWALDPHPDEAGNRVASASDPGHIGVGLQGVAVEDAVLRLRFMLVGGRDVAFNWRSAFDAYAIEGGEVTDSRYQIVVRDGAGLLMQRVQLPVRNLGVANSRTVPKAGAWHRIEIATFEGSTEVWVDGAPVMSYEDSQPLPAGGIGLELFPAAETSTVVYFDDIAVCGLSAPFVSMPTPEPTAAP